MLYIDTHSHLNLRQFSEDHGLVVERMRQHSVRTHTVGVDDVSSDRAIELSILYPDISRAVVGIHPAYVEPGVDYTQALVAIQNLAAHALCVGIGECGFDYFRCDKSLNQEIQTQVFRSQIEMAIMYNKPIMLHLRPSPHTVDAYDDALSLLSEYSGRLTGQAHFFAGTVNQARRFLDMGFYISCTGVVTFARDYDELVQFVPMDRLLTETDAPYVAPIPYRGSRAEPWHVIEVYKRIAELKSLSLDGLQQRVSGNVQALYGW